MIITCLVYLLGISMSKSSNFKMGDLVKFKIDVIRGNKRTEEYRYGVIKYETEYLRYMIYAFGCDTPFYISSRNLEYWEFKNEL